MAHSYHKGKLFTHRVIMVNAIVYILVVCLVCLILFLVRAFLCVAAKEGCLPVCEHWQLLGGDEQGGEATSRPASLGGIKLPVNHSCLIWCLFVWLLPPD